jgi:hypothetical protein
MSLVDALEPLVPTAIQLLTESIRLRNTEGRGILAYLVRVLPLLNHEAHNLWRKEHLPMHLLTLCSYLFKSNQRGRYLDGVLPDDANDPHNWTEPLEAELMPAPRQVIELADIHSMRETRAKALCNTAPPNPSDDGADLPTRFALSIVQDHLAYKQHASYRHSFTQCQRVGCPRPAWITAPEPTDDNEDDVSGAAEYWKCCRDGRAPPPDSSLPSDMSFCCHGCYKAASAEFKRIVKFDIVTPPSQTRNGGATTPSRLYRAAIKRNADVARTMRTHEEVSTKHYPSTMANRERMLTEQRMMLSVDLGLLYAASIVHELPPRLRPARPLPCRDDWRDHASSYLNAICRVREIYKKHSGPVITRTGNELWLRRLRDQALYIF